MDSEDDDALIESTSSAGSCRRKNAALFCLVTGFLAMSVLYACFILASSLVGTAGRPQHRSLYEPAAGPHLDDDGGASQSQAQRDGASRLLDLTSRRKDVDMLPSAGDNDNKRQPGDAYSVHSISVALELLKQTILEEGQRRSDLLRHLANARLLRYT